MATHSKPMLLILLAAGYLTVVGQQAGVPCSKVPIYKGDGLYPQLGHELVKMKAVSGRLLDHQNAPVRGVCIGLFSEHSDDLPRLVKSVETDEDGYFRMANVNTGRYRLVARVPGFFVVDIPVIIVGKYNLMVRRKQIAIKLELVSI
jgi:hypothetical protein